MGYHFQQQDHMHTLGKIDYSNINTGRCLLRLAEGGRDQLVKHITIATYAVMHRCTMRLHIDNVAPAERVGCQ